MRNLHPAWWLAGLALVAVVLPTWVSVPLVVLAAVLVGATHWWVRRVAAALEVRCAAPAWAYFEEAVEAQVEIANRSRLPAAWVELDVPCGLGLGRTEPHREAVRVPAGERVARRLPLVGVRRGRHRVGPPRLRVGDVLGTADARPRPVEPATVTVFPRIVPLERLGLPALSPFVTVPSSRSVLVDPTAVVGVRAYRVGDPFSSIHWTASARTRQLMSKQYERAEARETLVCLDLSARGYPRAALRPSVELAITVAASVLHHAILEQRLPAGLLAAAWSPDAEEPRVHLPPRADGAHLRRLLELLALAEPDASTPLGELLADVGQVPPGTTVLAVTGRLDAAVAAALLHLTRLGVPAAVALTGPTAAEDTLRVDDVWLPVYRVSDVPAVRALAG